MHGHCFISHASEDKDAFVRPLAQELKRMGVNVWYDEYSLRPGDSLRRSIDKGLTDCKVGIVVLSKAFFAKEWPQRELDALMTAEIGGNKKLIPIWHGVDAQYIANVSAMLADKVAIASGIGAPEVAKKIHDQLPPLPHLSNEVVAKKIRPFLSNQVRTLESLSLGCQSRFSQIQAFCVEVEEIASSYFDPLTDDEVEDQMWEIEEKIKPVQREMAELYDIPSGIELSSFEAIPEERIPAWLSAFDEWVSGTMGREETKEFILDLDNYLEIDYLYILLGIAPFSVNDAQRELLDDAIVTIGCQYEEEDDASLQHIYNRLLSSNAAARP
jgi:hypothetical protein